MYSDYVSVELSSVKLHITFASEHNKSPTIDSGKVSNTNEEVIKWEQVSNTNVEVIKWEIEYA